MLDILNDHFTTYSGATDLSLNLLNPRGEIIQTYGESCQFCRLFQEATESYCPCAKTHQHACQQAVTLGESYIFACPSGLIHFAVAILRDDTHIGSIMAGPILLELPDIHMVDDVLSKYDLSINYRNKLYTAMSAIPLVEPYRARHLSKMLSLLVSNVYSDNQSKLQERSLKAMQQSRIGEYMHLIKQNPAASPSQYQLEKNLIANVQQGNVEGAKATLNEMLGRIYFASGNNVEIIKTKTIELTALLSRAVIEAGGDPEQVYEMTNNYFHQISKTTDLTALSFSLMETLEQFTNLAFPDVSDNYASLIRKSIQYIKKNYQRNLTLEETAGYIGLNASYFSTVFKKETGINFTAYLSKVRIDQAKYLLKETNMPLLSIALELGFESQSYFSSVFKKNAGMTPKQFRHSL